MKKIQYNSPVILSFFLISLFTLGLDWISKGWTTAALFSVYRSPLSNPLTYFRLFGHVLGHADLEHFFGNMLMFLVIGPPMEERYGSRSLLIGILLTALVSGILQTALFPHSALLGASGIVTVLHGKRQNSPYPDSGGGFVSGAGTMVHRFHKRRCGQFDACDRRCVRNDLRAAGQ